MTMFRIEMYLNMQIMYIIYTYVDSKNQNIYTLMCMGILLV